jgi:hypothetical protein
MSQGITSNSKHVESPAMSNNRQNYSKHVESPAMSNNKHTNEIENGKLK